MTDTVARSLARFAHGLHDRGLPDEVARSVRRRVLDTLGLCVAAHRLATSTAVTGYALDQGGSPRAGIIGTRERVPAPLAALANGVLAHSLDYDDTHLPSILHPSAVVVPAALAAAEYAGADGAATERAVAAGLETTVRLGMAGYDRALGNSVFFEHGQHATSICGAMGAAVAASLLLGSGPEDTVHALGLTASFASGVIEANRTGGTVKRLHCGWAAQSALGAAQLVARGFTGPPTVIEGRFGFLRAFLREDADVDTITDRLGEEWEVPGIFFKPYPANHFTHTVIDAGIRLRSRVDPQDVAGIRVGVPAAVIRTIGEPLEVKRTPETGYQAQFSAPYAVVAGLLGGGGLGVGTGDFTDDLARDPRRRALMALVEVVPDPACDDIYPHQFPAVVTVRTRDGRLLREEVLHNRGGPANPLTDDDLTRKFLDNTAGRLPRESALAARELALNLGDLAHAGELVRALEPPEPDARDPRPASHL